MYKLEFCWKCPHNLIFNFCRFCLFFKTENVTSIFKLISSNKRGDKILISKIVIIMGRTVSSNEELIIYHFKIESITEVPNTCIMTNYSCFLFNLFIVFIYSDLGKVPIHTTLNTIIIINQK